MRIQAALRHHPLLGEHIYTAKYKGGDSAGEASSRVAFPRQALHAARLAFRHPTTARRVEFTARLPADLKQLLARLRA